MVGAYNENGNRKLYLKKATGLSDAFIQQDSKQLPLTIRWSISKLFKLVKNCRGSFYLLQVWIKMGEKKGFNM